MATVAADWVGVHPQWQRTTQPQITTAFLEETGLGWASECTSAGSTTTLVDAQLANAYTNNREWKGFWIRMVSGTALNLGAIRQVQSYTPASGTLTVSPVLPAATADGDQYEIWGTTMEPFVVLNMLNRVTSTYGLGLQTYSVLSEVPDFDMEQPGTTAWTSNNATLTKVEWDGIPGVWGKRAMDVLTTSAGGYAQSTAIRMRGGNSLCFSAVFTPTDPTVTNTGFIQLVDAVTGALIQQYTTTSKSPTRLWQAVGNGSVNTNLVYIRFGSLEDGVTGRWDDIVLQDMQARDIALPWWMGNESAFKTAFIWQPAQSGPSYQEYDPQLVGKEAQGWRPFTDMFTNGGQLRLKGDSFPIQMVYVAGVRFEEPWATLTETKHIDLQWAAACLAVNYYRRLNGQFVGNEAKAKEILRALSIWQEQFKFHDDRVRSQARTAESPVVRWTRI